MSKEKSPKIVTVEQLVGARIMPRLEVERFFEDEAYRLQCEAFVIECWVLGFCIFGGSSEQVVTAITRLQEVAVAQERSLVFSADCEWGLPMRLRMGGTEFPDAMAIAQTGEATLASEVGQAIGEEMRAIGIGWNFAPVADINSNPRNPIINTRSFSDETEVVVEFALEFAKGLESAGVASTAKHFPGHGDTMVDSHSSLPAINRSLEVFESRELVPFKELIAAGVRSIMLGHIAAPKLARAFGASTAEAFLPATLSRAIITKLLRERLGYNGVLVTDAMEMHSITNEYSSRESTLMAARAGVDVILMPIDPKETFRALLEDAKSRNPESTDFQEHFERIEKLLNFCKVTEPRSTTDMSSVAHQKLAKSIAKKSVSVQGDLSKLKAAKLLIISDDKEQTVQRAQYLEHELAGSKHFSLIARTTVAEVLKREDLLEFDAIATFHRARGYLGGAQSAVTMPSVIRKIAEKLRNQDSGCQALILIGSPYLDEDFGMPSPNCLLKSFSESKASIDEVLHLLK